MIDEKKETYIKLYSGGNKKIDLWQKKTFVFYVNKSEEKKTTVLLTI